MSVESKWYGAEKKKSMFSAMQRTIVRAGNIIQTDQELLVPVKDGDLKKSIVKGVDNLEVQVGTNLEYAGFQEFGTRHFPAQPYIRPSLSRNKDKIIKIAEDEGAKAVG